MTAMKLKAAYRSVAPGFLRRWVDTIRYPQDMAAARIQHKYHSAKRQELFAAMALFARVNRPIDGAYMEFGSFGANTMRLAWKCFGHFKWNFIAFDSFEGLPKITEIDEQVAWEPGKLAMSEQQFVATTTSAGMPRARLRTVKGFYNETLTGALAATIKQKAAVIYVDCDLYVSTVDVLTFIPQFLQPGTIIVFDDWDCFTADPNKGERRAWGEFRARHPELKFEEFFHAAIMKAFVCVAP
jgi:hypothetical protein